MGSVLLNRAVLDATHRIYCHDSAVLVEQAGPGGAVLLTSQDRRTAYPATLRLSPGGAIIDPPLAARRTRRNTIEEGPMPQYDIRMTPAQLRAAADWSAREEGMADVSLLVDDSMLIAYQGDDMAAWDTDGSPASAEYLQRAPLDR